MFHRQRVPLPLEGIFYSRATYLVIESWLQLVTGEQHLLAFGLGKASKVVLLPGAKRPGESGHRVLLFWRSATTSLRALFVLCSLTSFLAPWVFVCVCAPQWT